MAAVVKTWNLTWVNGDVYTVTVKDDGSTWLNISGNGNQINSYQFNLSDWVSVAPQVAQTQGDVLAANALCPHMLAVGTTGAELTCDLPNGHTQPAFHHDPATGGFWLPPQ